MKKDLQCILAQNDGLPKFSPIDLSQEFDSTLEVTTTKQ